MSTEGTEEHAFSFSRVFEHACCVTPVVHVYGKASLITVAHEEGGIIGKLGDFVGDAVDYDTFVFSVLCDEAGNDFGD